MSTVLGERSLAGFERGAWKPWLAIVAGLLVLYVPTYIELARGLWREDEYAHGPLILLVFGYLLWRSRDKLLGTDPGSAWVGSVPGFALLVAGLLLYIVGRSQSLPLFEVLSHFPVLAGVLLMMRGPRAVRGLGFALLFLVFLVPLPGFVLESIAIPLKALVSAAVEAILRLASYPIERHGVVLLLGDHEMLVADACSGLNSLYSLAALSLLYTHVTPPASKARAAVMLAAMVPIAIVANIVRVLVLVLIEYHLGEGASAGIVHTVTGMLVFMTAFAMLLGVDKLFKARGTRHETQKVQARGTRHETQKVQARGTRHETQDVEAEPSRPLTHLLAPRASRLVPWCAALLMLGTALAAPLLKPVRAEGPALDLQVMVPQAFGDWSIDPTVAPVPLTPEVQEKLDRIYSETLSRTYVNAAGEQMMLTMAYGGDQSDALKAHRQEVCYTAQGFSVHGLERAELSAAGRSVPVTRMLAVRGERSEPVTYWFTMGDRVVRSRLERLEVQLAAGFHGRIPDGMLVRVSSISTDPHAAFGAQQAFIAALLAALPPVEAARVAGVPRT